MSPIIGGFANDKVQETGQIREVDGTQAWCEMRLVFVQHPRGEVSSNFSGDYKFGAVTPSVIPNVR